MYISVIGEVYSNNWQGEDEWKVFEVIVPVRVVRSERNYTVGNWFCSTKGQTTIVPELGIRYHLHLPVNISHSSEYPPAIEYSSAPLHTSSSIQELHCAKMHFGFSTLTTLIILYNTLVCLNTLWLA